MRGAVHVAGNVEVDATCGDGVDITIDRGSDVLESFHLPNRSRGFQLDLDLVLGETLYFRVEPGSDSRCDTTWLQVTITGLP